MPFPVPQLGFWTAECCELDLYQIETEQDLRDALDRIEANDECGDLMVFPTKEEALAYLGPDHC